MAAVLLLTGAPGTGKSSTLDALATLLEIDEVEFGAIEAEQLAWGSPWLSVAEAARQLEAVLCLQRRGDGACSLSPLACIAPRSCVQLSPPCARNPF